MKEIAAPSSVVTAASVRSASKSQEQNVTAAPPAPTLSENNGSNAAIDKMENTHETEGVCAFCWVLYLFFAEYICI